MRRVLCAFPLLYLLAGCQRPAPQQFTPLSSPERKAELENLLPEYITSDLRSKASPGSKIPSAVCERVVLTETSPGHYTGDIYYTNGVQTKTYLVDDGKKFYFEGHPY